MVPTLRESSRRGPRRPDRAKRRYACYVTSTPRPRLLALALAGSFLVGGCYSLAEPSFHPGDQRDILQTILLRGIVTGEPIAGETACDDHDLVGNSLYLTARMPDEVEPRDVYIHMYREKYWDRSAEEVDGCQAEYAAANPDAEITRLDIPTYRVFGADWSEELTDELTKALEEASQAGKD
jgi:hypothetical protein